MSECDDCIKHIPHYVVPGCSEAVNASLSRHAQLLEGINNICAQQHAACFAVVD